MLKLFNREKTKTSGVKKEISIAGSPGAKTEVAANQVLSTTGLPTIGVLGAKGGVGATTVAINLAACLARDYGQTTLLDADFQQPDAATLCGITPRFTLLDLLGRSSDLDRQAFDAFGAEVSPTGSGLKLLCPPLTGEAWLRTDLSQLSMCFEKIQGFSRCWVIDLPNHLDRHLVTFLDRLSYVVMVFEASLTGVAACRRWMSIFKELGYPQGKVLLVLNRAGSRKSAVEDELKSCFSGNDIFKIPNAYGAVWDSSARGQPLVMAQPNHAFSKALSSLSLRLTAKSDFKHKRNPQPQ